VSEERSLLDDPEVVAAAQEVKPRRVHFLAWRDLDDAEGGGSEVHAHEVAKRLASLNLEVSMRTSRVFGQPQVVYRDGYVVERRAGRYMVFPRAIGAGVLGLDRDLAAVVEIWNGMPFFSPLWFRGPKVVVLHHIHGEMWDMMFPPVLARLGSFVEEVVAPALYREVPIVTLSESSREEIVARMGFRPERVKVAEPGLDPEFHYRGPKSQEPLVVGVGRLAPVKRFSLFLDVVEEARKLVPSLRAVIAGDGYERYFLLKQIHDRGMDSFVELRGYVPRPELVRLLGKAWVLLATSCREGWGLAISEAGACGTPAVATDIVGHRSSVVHGVTGLVAATKDELVAALVRLLTDADLRRRLGHNARERAKELSWDKTARTILLTLASACRRQR
jgi:glycosyltransferase involved in cell wall biosynthesis